MSGAHKAGCYTLARSISDAIQEHGLPHTFDLSTLHTEYAGLPPPKAGRLLRGCLELVADLLKPRHGGCLVAYSAGTPVTPARVAVSPPRVCPRCHAPLRMCGDADPACMHCDSCQWCGDPTTRRPNGGKS